MKRRMRKTGLSSLAIGLFLAGSIGEAFAAPMIVHDSLEKYFADSVTLVPEGTVIATCVGEGCAPFTPQPFSVGDTTGTLLWQVTEKVFKDSAATIGPTMQTQFNYAVANVGFPSLPTPTTINSFTVEHNGFDTFVTEIASFTVPAGWAFTVDATDWIWTCVVATTCVFPSSLLTPVFTSGFSVTLAGLIPVGFDLTTIDLGTAGVPTGAVLSSTDWIVSAPLAAIAEPSTLFLLGIGLVGLGVWSRKQKRLAEPA